jgi:transposase
VDGDEPDHRDGTPIVEDPQRLADVDAIGVDETAYLRATGRHPTWFATGITDLTPGRPTRLLDVAEGRSGTVLGGWLGARDPDWRARIYTASLDPFRGYATALATQLPRHHPGAGPLPRRQTGPDPRR